jgi:hypothetical protein
MIKRLFLSSCRSLSIVYKDLQNVKWVIQRQIHLLRHQRPANPPLILQLWLTNLQTRRDPCSEICPCMSTTKSHSLPCDGSFKFFSIDFGCWKCRNRVNSEAHTQECLQSCVLSGSTVSFHLITVHVWYFIGGSLTRRYILLYKLSLWPNEHSTSSWLGHVVAFCILCTFFYYQNSLFPQRIKQT